MMKSILEYLKHSAQEYPNKTAFADENASCTFGELKEKADKIGSDLAKYNCQRQPVPVLMEKGVDTIGILMGIVSAGGFYVVLDASHPAARLNAILETLEADVLIYQQKFEEMLAQLEFSGRMIRADVLGTKEANSGILTGIQRKAKDTDPLYGIFTSGSTGVPKGVVVSHRSVIDFIDVFTEIFGITQEDVIGNQAPWDFDVSVKDIYSCLKTGAEMQMIPRTLFSFPIMLLDFLREKEVTVLIWAVSALCIASSLPDFHEKVPKNLKKVLFSGEVMPVKHLNIWRKCLPEAMFVNLYGPTEITCNCTYYVVDGEFQTEDVLPMGRAFPNEMVFLLDDKDKLVGEEETGKVGEICVSGSALALGYYNDWEQTEKVFVQNPLHRHYRDTVYRTGDLAYYDADRNLCFASRKDFQIKHMGHRIELGEIERALELVEAVTRSSCFFDESKSKIVAFYQGEIQKRELYKELAKYLPDYMIPKAIRKLEEMPLNKNGKIDKKRLKELYYKK